MAQDDLARQLGNTFQALIDEETRGMPTRESPIIVKREGSGLSLIIHDCIQKRINEHAARLNIPRSEAKASFVSAVMDGLLPKVGLNMERRDFDRITVERRTKLVNVPIRVINPHAPDYSPHDTNLRAPNALDSNVHAPRQVWSEITADGVTIESPVTAKELRRVPPTFTELDYSNPAYPNGVITLRQSGLPRPTGISRLHDHVISIQTEEYSVEQLIEERLKAHAGEMRAILEEALKQKRPIFNLRLFEGTFFSPTIGGGDDETEVTWAKTATNGIREGLKFTVKSLSSIAISGMFLYASNYVGHWVRPDVVPAPATVVSAVVEQFKNVEMEVSGEGVKLTAKKEDSADENEAKRLIENIGGDSAPMAKQKALVKYLESKYAEGLVTGVPIVKATVVEKVRDLVKANESNMTTQIKEALAKATTVKTAIPTEQGAAKNKVGTSELSMTP